MNKLLESTSKHYWVISTKVLSTIALLLAPLAVTHAAEAPTFSNEVVRILQQNCQLCHQPGGIAPMPLQTYDQARVWAPRIKENVLRRVIPPWHLDPTIGIQEYKNDF